MNTYIGCSGWNYKDWAGNFYPKELKKKEWLTYYSERFNSVEVNNTFYKMPKKETLEKWHQQSSYPFKFSLKGSRYITHMKKLNDVRESVKSFYDVAETLRNKLGCILWQLPPNLHFDKNRLEQFCQWLSGDFRNVIEFRHESWFNESVYDILHRYDVSFCMISAHGFEEIVKRTTRTGYLRFHGKDKDWYRYYYSEQDLEEWKEKMAGLSLSELYVYFNNDYNAYAPKNAWQFEELMSAVEEN